MFFHYIVEESMLYIQYYIAEHLDKAPVAIPIGGKTLIAGQFRQSLNGPHHSGLSSI